MLLLLLGALRLLPPQTMRPLLPNSNSPPLLVLGLLKEIGGTAKRQSATLWADSATVVTVAEVDADIP